MEGWYLIAALWAASAVGFALGWVGCALFVAFDPLGEDEEG